MARVSAKKLSDEQLLGATLQHPSRLDNFEKKKFEEWLTQVEGGGALSEKQRAMVEKKFKLIGLEEKFDAANIASVMKVTGAKVTLKSQEQLEALMGPKFLSPPRRKAPID